ncbi:MAG: cytochrome c [Alphaproteobacteria bacterium]|nr:MAG: cytochrome c [Alphaproteobacteria bacterium]
MPDNKHFIVAALLAATSLPALGDDDTGRALYDANCGGCHQADGGGVPMMQPALIGSERANGEKGAVIDMILFGSEIIDPGMSDYNNEMPSFSHLSDQEIAELATYVRTHFDNDGGPVGPDDVRARRR